MVRSKKNRTSKKSPSRLKKGLVRAILTLLVLIIVLVVLVVVNRNFIVKYAIERFGSEIVGTSISVERVDIGLSNGSAGIYGLTVANPTGFDAPNAFSLGEISTALQLKSLFSKVMVIDDIVVDAPVIVVEINEKNEANLNELRKNMPESSSSAPAGSSESSGTSLLRIRHLRFSQAQIKATVKRLNKKYNFELASFEMNNLGGEKGATPAGIIGQIIGTISKRALDQVKEKGIAVGKERARQEVKSKVEQQAKNKLRTLFK